MTESDDRKKLNDLGARLDAVHRDEANKHGAEEAKRESSQGVGIGMRIGIELLAAVLAGAGIGYFIDTKFHTKPIFMLAFIVLGFATGVLDVLRVIKGLDRAVGLGRAIREKDTKSGPGFSDDDDD